MITIGTSTGSKVYDIFSKIHLFTNTHTHTHTHFKAMKKGFLSPATKNRKKKKPQENLDKKDPETGLTKREKREMIKILQRQNEKLIMELREQQRLTGGVVSFRLYERGPRRVL